MTFFFVTISIYLTQSIIQIFFTLLITLSTKAQDGVALRLEKNKSYRLSISSTDEITQFLTGKFITKTHIEEGDFNYYVEDIKDSFFIIKVQIDSLHKSSCIDIKLVGWK